MSTDHHSFRRFCLFSLAAAVLPTLIGCDARVEHPVVFEPNLVHAMKYELQRDLPMDQASEDANWVVTKMFGTPDEPALPKVIQEDEDLASVVSLERLERASGPAIIPGRGLFRKHCAECHGVTGNGRGPLAAVQTPYPRDYRMGIFKFKSTPRGTKPTREDLAELIRNGIAGTAMKKIPELTEEDVQALVDYVIYLSMRGEHERTQIDMGILDGILESEERLINSDLGRRLDADPSYQERLEKLMEKEEDQLTESEAEEVAQYERFLDDWGYAEDYAADIAESWLEAQDEIVDIPEPPTDLPLAENYEDVQQILASDQADEFHASVERGRELFVGKLASCSKCHGEKGLGNGQTTDYDDWTKDWTTRVGFKPEEREKLIPLLARGALEPRNSLPRNFQEGVFRGGSNSADLYHRITQGIDGTPMPAATFVEGEFEEEDVWHLINYIRSLQTEPSEPLPRQTETASQT